MELVKTTGNGPLGSFRHRWYDNVRMDLKGGVSMRNCSRLIQLRIGIIGEPM